MVPLMTPAVTSGGSGLETGSVSSQGSGLLDSAEQQMLKLITDQRSQGASLSDILGDLELTSGADKPIFRLAPSVEQKRARRAGSAAGPREARFVPYEPYAGCVSPLDRSPSSAAPPPPRDEASGSSGSSGSAAGMGGDEADGAGRAADEESRLDELRRENERLQEQLGVSMEVTAELKKLLVASIGEDIESRLHLLTEDKARLAQLVRSFSAQAAAQGEGRDHLRIQCDVWRSKFMACSLMVDELAGWKAVLGRRCRDAENALRALLAERRQITSQLTTAVRCLTSVGDGIDPASARVGPALSECHAVQLAERTAQMGTALHQRLLGRPPPATDPAIAPAAASASPSAAASNTVTGPAGAATSAAAPVPSTAAAAADSAAAPVQAAEPKTPTQEHRRSPAEVAAEKVLSSSACHEFSVHRDACKDRGMLDRFHPHVRSEHLTMYCCTHCSGDIYVV